MPKTKESIAAYNKEYFARPEVVARAKERNAQYRQRRAAYKKTEAGMIAERRYWSGTRRPVAERNRLKHRYGLTPEQVRDMEIAQHGLCAVCRQAFASFHIDHDHATGAVRGLLCSPCNMAIGLFKDNKTSLANAIVYLSNGV